MSKKVLSWLLWLQFRSTLPLKFSRQINSLTRQTVCHEHYVMPAWFIMTKSNWSSCSKLLFSAYSRSMNTVNHKKWEQKTLRQWFRHKKDELLYYFIQVKVYTIDLNAYRSVPIIGTVANPKIGSNNWIFSLWVPIIVFCLHCKVV